MVKTFGAFAVEMLHFFGNRHASMRKPHGAPHHAAQRVDKPHPCHSEEYPKGTCFAARSNAAIRSQRGTAALTGRRGRRPLQSGVPRLSAGHPEKTFFPKQLILPL